ncbi:MAG TPA: oligosaccharide flippase family protein [Stellaceae bacterium]|nr:oligosaccharide flippase family protein [Stellaceae bacterium]
MKLGRLFALGSLASLAPLVEFSSRLGRTVILSRNLTPTEFGIGAALTVLMGIAWLSTDLGLDRFLILRAPEEDRDTLAAAHQLSALRGAAIGVLIFLAAPWAAAFFGAPGNAWSFRAIAGVVLLHSLAHLEIKQTQRNFRYGPDAMAYVIAHSAVLLAVYPAVRLLGDHRAVLVVLYIEGGTYVAVSHIVARQRYSLWSKRPEIRRAALAYGLPLSLNGIGLAVMSQLDRALVSHWFGLEELAFYAIILNMTVIPISAIQRVLNQLAMSFLADRRGDPIATARVNFTVHWAYALAAAVYALFVAASLDLLAPLIFGAVYRVPPAVHALVAVIVWIRVFRGAPTLILLSAGDTTRLLAANLVAVSWVPVAAAALPLWPGLATVLAAVLIGDALSLVSFLWNTRRRLKGQVPAVLRQLAWSFAAMSAGFLSIWAPALDAPLLRPGFLALALVLAALQLAYGAWRFLPEGSRAAAAAEKIPTQSAAMVPRARNEGNP